MGPSRPAKAVLDFPDEDDDDAPIIRGRGRGSGAGRASRTAKGAAAQRENMQRMAEAAGRDYLPIASGSSISTSLVSEVRTMASMDGDSGVTTAVAGIAALELPRTGGDSGPGSAVSVATSAGTSRTSGTIFTRPKDWDKKGKDGTVLEVITNYFEVSKQAFQPLYQFRVDFSPDEDATHIKKSIMKTVPVGKYIFDGQVMYKTTGLTSGQTADKDTYVFEGKCPDGKTYGVRIRLIGLVSPTDPVYLQFYNILLRRCMELLQLEELGRNYYDRHKKVAIEEAKLELWPGFSTAIRHHEQRLFLCVEITHKVLRTATVMEEIRDMLNKWKEHPRKNEMIKEELVGQIVMSKYNRKTYRIDDIDFESTPDSCLGGEEDKEIYAEYFQRKYNETVHDKKQPMLVSKPRKRDINKGITNNIYLVPSLCNMTGLSEEIRKNFQVMKRVSEKLHVTPDERKKRLDTFMETLRGNPDVQKEFQAWNIDFSPQFVTVDARYLGQERIILANNSEVRPDYLGDWTSGLRGNKLASCKDVVDWVLIIPEQDKTKIKTLVDGVQKQARALGMRVQDQMAELCYESRRPINERQLADFMKNLSKACKFVLFVLPNNQLQRYAAVKKFFTLEYKVVTQCFLAKNIMHKSFNSICSKLMIQVNAKLGGEPWQVKVPLKQLMVLGFDVYHCTERKNQSVGALISTISPNLARYFSTVSFHKDKAELSSNMYLDTRKCLDAYLKANNELPATIVMYRDGVGEGQVAFVLEHEIEHIKKALGDVYGKHGLDLPRFAFVIVTKKINTRILVQDQSSKAFTNPAPGTVVDDVITLPERYDFFLVSQSVRQGTVSPTNYNVIYDSSGLSADRMQRLTYKMCHLYFNWAGTVAVPAPCQYAHKLAYLTGVAVNDPAPVQLADVLWFL